MISNEVNIEELERKVKEYIDEFSEIKHQFLKKEEEETAKPRSRQVGAELLR